MEILTMEQGSTSWFAARLGLVTSSKFSDVMAKGKGNAPSKTRETYMKELACERITGRVQESYSNVWMQRGTELEPQVRAMLELDKGFDVELVGFIKMNDDIGSSTDGLIGEDAVLEIKCPKHTTHLDYLLDSNGLYADYKTQVQGELFVTGRSKAYLCSFHPDFPSGKDLIVLEIARDEDFIKQIEIDVFTFVHELKKLTKQIKGE
jgi:predicted phage-related endonuclease